MTELNKFLIKETIVKKKLISKNFGRLGGRNVEMTFFFEIRDFLNIIALRGHNHEILSILRGNIDFSIFFDFFRYFLIFTNGKIDFTNGKIYFTNGEIYFTNRKNPKISKNRCYTSKVPEFHGYVSEGQLY